MKSLIAVGAALIALSLGACGSDQESSGGGSSTGQSSTDRGREACFQQAAREGEIGGREAGVYQMQLCLNEFGAGD